MHATSSYGVRQLNRRSIVFKATYHTIKDQFSSLYFERCNYAKILLAPLATYILFLLIMELSTAIDKHTTSYAIHNWNIFMLGLLTLILTPLTIFYGLKSIVQTIRLIVLKEQPTVFFGIYLFKQSYLMFSYLCLHIMFVIIFSTISSFIILAPLLIYYLYSFTWYPYNLISAAADVHVDFYKVGFKIGKWAILNFFILVIFLCLYIIVFYSQTILPKAIHMFIYYLVVLNHLGCYARSYNACENLHKK